MRYVMRMIDEGWETFVLLSEGGKECESQKVTLDDSAKERGVAKFELAGACYLIPRPQENEIL